MPRGSERTGRRSAASLIALAGVLVMLTGCSLIPVPGSQHGGRRSVDPDAAPTQAAIDLKARAETLPWPLRPAPTGAYTPATVDADHAVSAKLGAAGGTISAQGADGTRYVLAVPADALVFDTVITMTPIVDVPALGAPRGAVRGVELAPYGLQLLHLATLTITDAQGHDIGPGAAFGIDGAGYGLAPTMMDPSPATTVIFVQHFTVFGVDTDTSDGPASIPQRFASNDPDVDFAARDAALAHQHAIAMAEFSAGFSKVLAQLARLSAAADSQGCGASLATHTLGTMWQEMARSLAADGVDVQVPAEFVAFADAAAQWIVTCWATDLSKCLKPDPRVLREYEGLVTLLHRLHVESWITGTDDIDSFLFDLQPCSEASGELDYHMTEPHDHADLTVWLSLDLRYDRDADSYVDAGGSEFSVSYASYIPAPTPCGTVTHVRGDDGGEFSDDWGVADDEVPSLNLTIADDQILLTTTVGAMVHSAFDACDRHDAGQVWTTWSLECAADGLGGGQLEGTMTSPSLGNVDCTLTEDGVTITVSGTLETKGYLDELVPASLWTGPF